MKVIASIASLASRIDSLKQTVASLIDQVDILNVYLNGHDNIPGFLCHPKVAHVVLSRDAGWRGAEAKLWFYDREAFKMPPYLAPDDICLTCDDDILYPQDYVERIKRGLEEYPQAVLCFHGSILKIPMRSYRESRVTVNMSKGLTSDTPVHVPGTATTAFYHSTLADISINQNFIWSHAVDPQLASYCKLNDIPVIALSRPPNWIKPISTSGISIFGQRVGANNDLFETNLLKDLLWTQFDYAHLESKTVPIPADLPRIQPNPKIQLPSEAVNWLARHLKNCDSGYVLEFGSGYGTGDLLQAIPSTLSLISIEHNPRFLNLFPGHTYVYAPIEAGGWYDQNQLASLLPSKELIRAVIVDGPGTRGRQVILEETDIWERAAVLISDAHIKDNMSIVESLSMMRRKMYSVHYCTDKRAFATIE